ncbi:hypothetical protein B0H16DRAFT_1697725 [Mycena metata]|uniref:F-box domain-containing protein n=1 Tax=Mycena metata TaxID=1033252 RepID=A0AAD7MPS5_9AGAR|nr:hypothetical protein B0H16DRAFT_1697725 [Mycena metata]
MAIRAALAEQTVKTEGRTAADIRRLVAESELRMTSLDSKIAELKLAAAPMEDDGPEDFKSSSVEGEAPLASASLLQQRDRERITAAVLRHLVSPIRSLPVELLAEIFLLTIRDKELDFLEKYKHFQDAYRVSHVCSEWQQIAHCTPQLWTGTIAVTVKEVGADTVDGLRAWFARSDPLPVPVILRAGRWPGNLETLPPVLEELLRVAPRWGILHCLDGFLPHMFYQRLADCTLDSLEAANLEPLYSDDDITSALFLLAISPRLRKLVLRLDLLDDPGTSVTLPSLRLLMLTLRSERNTHLSPFLNFLSAPALETLSISFLSDSISWTQAAFTAFLLRSSNITELCLRWCPLTSSDLITALAHAPSLTHLQLEGCHRLDDAFLLALHHHVDAGTPPLVPFLHDFHLEDMSELLTETLIVGMLTSRWRAGSATARWSRVVLSMQYTMMFFTKDFRHALRELAREGFPVEIPDELLEP